MNKLNLKIYLPQNKTKFKYTLHGYPSSCLHYNPDAGWTENIGTREAIHLDDPVVKYNRDEIVTCARIITPQCIHSVGFKII